LTKTSLLLVEKGSKLMETGDKEREHRGGRTSREPIHMVDLQRWAARSGRWNKIRWRQRRQRGG